MGDLGEYWNEHRQYKRELVNSGKMISMQYKTEEDRERGVESKNKDNYTSDMITEKRLKKLGLEPVYKNTHSFQVTINGKKGMYYCGRNEKLIIENKPLEREELNKLLTSEEE
jgi:hypothetical protein